MSASDVIHKHFVKFLPELEESKNKFPLQKNWEWFIFRSAYSLGYGIARRHYDEKLLKLQLALKESKQK